MKKLVIFLLAVFSISNVNAQKKVLDHQDAHDIWNGINSSSISRDGKWISYYLEAVGGGDALLKLKDTKGSSILEVDRGTNPSFTYSSKELIFKINPAMEEVNDLRRSKIKKDKLPKDSLGIFSIKAKSLVKIPRVKSYEVPEKWSGWIAYILEPDLPDNGKKDTTKKDENSNKTKAKKENKDNGYRLVIRNLETAVQDTFRYVTDYQFAKEGARLSFVTTGSDSTWLPGIYSYDFDSQSLKPVFRSKGEYKQLTWDEKGNQLAFVADIDTSKIQIRSFKLHYWKPDADTAAAIAHTGHPSVPQDWIIGPDGALRFSKDGTRLYFGTAPKPLVKDTMLLDEEIVNLEIWSHTDGKLHTQQNVEKERSLKKTYTAVYDTKNETIVQLGNLNIPDIRFDTEINASIVIGNNDEPYHQLITWEGFPYYNDQYVIDVKTGKSEMFGKKIRGIANLSPGAKFAYWYDRNDTAWFTYSVSQKKIFRVTNNETVPFYDEINDRPDYPSSYGFMSWTENDTKMLIYDRYDIWEVDPESKTAPVNLTKNGRSNQTTYRYVKMDDEERFISNKQKLILTAFNEKDKSEAIYSYTYGGSDLKELTRGNFHFGRFRKAQDSDELIYTKESFINFPDIHATNLSFKSSTRISTANPQQSEYSWGTAELYKFTSLDGQELEGMLFKPEGFDPNKKYPMLVNFYEKSSNGIHRHRSPNPPRSSINYSTYVSRGYVIFNPNVNYRIGYPGESAYDCVIPGVMSLIAEGYIDKDRIGIQGHSWGGYQISYLVTKTDLFACAEAGAPVVNMTSAYGGIRWGSGLSRMFQYEHTQSRIGGTLWEYPLRYIENSPLFFADKVNTPIMYMHNDADTAVPWYQGIEFFVALRRLGKPVWMLNYQGEPHGLGKMQNKKDFGIRMQQFFDYYLKDAPKPAWMEDGIPATDVGIDQHLLPADHK
jgi:dipeptidyl aminopeptidase/acylaminoacyl peptidase